VRGAKWGAGFAATYLIGKWLNDQTFDPMHAATTVLVFILAGWLFSPLTWWQREDRYKRALEQRAAKPPA
jgi:high-affinity Fe2+/Pb2+ permease